MHPNWRLKDRKHLDSSVYPISSILKTREVYIKIGELNHTAEKGDSLHIHSDWIVNISSYLICGLEQDIAS